jgi:hypothetical protein
MIDILGYIPEKWQIIYCIIMIAFIVFLIWFIINYGPGIIPPEDK